jgi:serine/threonine-protein kinase PpkA
VTKTQLSLLRKQLTAIFENAQQSFLKDDAKNFFQSILSAAAQITRDPNSFTGSPGKNLAQTGVMGEFLEGLPYKSAIMNLTEEEWYQKSTGEQKSILNHLEARIKLYEEYDRDNTNWEGFGSPNRNEWVYRIPLDMLP